jgi:hypothetical protein
VNVHWINFLHMYWLSSCLYRASTVPKHVYCSTMMHTIIKSQEY